MTEENSARDNALKDAQYNYCLTVEILLDNGAKEAESGWRSIKEAMEKYGFTPRDILRGNPNAQGLFDTIDKEIKKGLELYDRGEDYEPSLPDNVKRSCAPVISSLKGRGEGAKQTNILATHPRIST